MMFLPKDEQAFAWRLATANDGDIVMCDRPDQIRAAYRNRAIEPTQAIPSTSPPFRWFGRLIAFFKSWFLPGELL